MRWNYVQINVHFHLHADKKQASSLYLFIQSGDRFLGLFGGCDSPLSTLNLAGKIVILKPSNRTGGPRTDVLETHLPYMDPRVAEERKRRTAQLDATTMPIRVIQFGWKCRDRTLSSSPKKNV